VKVLDLFAGAGGASLGAKQAGATLVGAAEWDPSACEAHRQGLPGCPVFEGDLRQLDPPAADVWWASPPCQAWSSAGDRLGAQDPRNGWPWVWDLYDALPCEDRPQWLITENVVGMTHHKSDGCGDPLACPGCYLSGVVIPELRSRFRYVEARILLAADFGVPQMRRRLFIVCGPEPYRWPTPTHCDPRQRLLLACGRQPWVTMGEALGLSRGTLHASGITGASPPRSVSEVARSVTAKGTAYLNQPAPTVLATEAKGHTGVFADRGRASRIQRASDALALATGRRRLTVSECAILQGFAKDYPFQGTKSAQYRQVGNAVPPAFARALIGVLA